MQVGLQIGTVYIDTPKRSFEPTVTGYRLDGYSRRWEWFDDETFFVIFRDSTGVLGKYTGTGDRDDIDNWVVQGPFKCSLLEEYLEE